MSVELNVIRASEFIRMDPHEHIDFQQSKAALETLARACLKRGIDKALLDLRAMPLPPQPRFTLPELAELVLAFHDAGFTSPQRLAILASNDLHGGAREFAFISRLKGLQVQTFVTFDAAFDWLSEALDGGSREGPGESQVPISLR